MVIVLAAGGNGLGALRSLSRSNLKIYLIANDRADPSLLSKFYFRKAVLPSASSSDRRRELFRLLDEVKQEYTVVIPTSDWYLAKLQEYVKLYPLRFKVCLPNEKISSILIDKARETHLIGNVVPIPKTVQDLPSDYNSLLNALSLPIIIKPRSFEHNTINTKNIQIFTIDDLVCFYKDFGNTLSNLIAQEIIEGKDENLWVCNCTFNYENEIIGAFIFRRIRLSPSHYGVTSYAVSEWNPEIFQLSQKIGKKINYHGPAMIEFKYDPVDSNYKYIELNPRLGMCNYFDTFCGINNVWLAYLLSLGENINPQNIKQKDGVIFLSLYDDFYSRIKDGEKIIKIILHYFKSITRKHVFMYFIYVDPLPGVVMTFRHIKNTVRSLAGKVMKKIKLWK